MTNLLSVTAVFVLLVLLAFPTIRDLADVLLSRDCKER
jgi:hypothetical protein